MLFFIFCKFFRGLNWQRQYFICNSLDFMHRSHCFDHRAPGEDSTETHHERQILQGVFYQERYTYYMSNCSANVCITYLRNLLAVFNSLAWVKTLMNEGCWPLLPLVWPYISLPVAYIAFLFILKYSRLKSDWMSHVKSLFKIAVIYLHLCSTSSSVLPGD